MSTKPAAAQKGNLGFGEPSLLPHVFDETVLEVGDAVTDLLVRGDMPKGKGARTPGVVDLADGPHVAFMREPPRIGVDDVALVKEYNGPKPLYRPLQEVRLLDPARYTARRDRAGIA